MNPTDRNTHRDPTAGEAFAAYLVMILVVLYTVIVIVRPILMWIAG